MSAVENRVGWAMTGWGPLQTYATGSQAWSGWESRGFRSNWGHFVQQNCCHLSTLGFLFNTWLLYVHKEFWADEQGVIEKKESFWWPTGIRGEAGSGQVVPNQTAAFDRFHTTIARLRCFPNLPGAWNRAVTGRAWAQRRAGSIFLRACRKSNNSYFYGDPDQSSVVSSLQVMIWHFGTVVSCAVSSRARHHLSLWNSLHSIKLHFLWSDHIPLAPVLNFPHHTPSKTPSVLLEETRGAGRPLNSGCKFWMISVHSWTWFTSDQVQNKPPSIVLQAVCLSDLTPWIYFSLPPYNCKGFDLGHTWMV